MKPSGGCKKIKTNNADGSLYDILQFDFYFSQKKTGPVLLVRIKIWTKVTWAGYQVTWAALDNLQVSGILYRMWLSLSLHLAGLKVICHKLQI